MNWQPEDSYISDTGETYTIDSVVGNKIFCRDSLGNIVPFHLDGLMCGRLEKLVKKLDNSNETYKIGKK